MIDGNDYTFEFLKMLIGDFGLMMYLEILIRVIIIMSYTILMIRWIGKRAIGNIGSADILLIIAMGSSVGDAMLYPSVPLAVALAVITLIAGFQKLYVFMGIEFRGIRKVTHPRVLKLVEKGKLLEGNFEIDEIDKNEVLMLLRQEGIRYLSEVEHAYYEQSGILSVFKYDNPIFEHSILPEDLDDLKVSN